MPEHNIVIAFLTGMLIGGIVIHAYYYFKYRPLWGWMKAMREVEKMPLDLSTEE